MDLNDDGQTINNNATGVEGVRLRAKLFMADEVFKRDVLQIQPSDRHGHLTEPRSDINRSFPSSSGNPTSRIRRFAGLKMLVYDDFDIFHAMATLDEAKWTFSRQWVRADDICTFSGISRGDTG